LVGGFLLTAVLSLGVLDAADARASVLLRASVMLLVLLIANIDWPMPHPSLLQAVRSLLAAAALVLFFRQTVPQYRAAMADFTNPAWPRWSGEVQKWENDQRYQPKIPPCWDGNCWKGRSGGHPQAPVGDLRSPPGRSISTWP